MRIAVVYDSVYGNTERVAQVIGGALPGEVSVVRTSQADPAGLKTVDLLVIGSPTHGSLPTESMRVFLKRLGAPVDDGPCVATFDTRLSWGFLRKHGFAGDRIAEELGARGWTIQGSPGGFLVKGLRKGPLRKGELERAAGWAEGLVEDATP
jgi:flavodoxin